MAFLSRSISNVFDCTSAASATSGCASAEGGPHSCLGAHRARREISILFQEPWKRTSSIDQSGDPGFRVADIEIPTVVSLGRLPVRLKATRRRWQ